MTTVMMTMTMTMMINDYNFDDEFDHEMSWVESRHNLLVNYLHLMMSIGRLLHPKSNEILESKYNFNVLKRTSFESWLESKSPKSVSLQCTTSLAFEALRQYMRHRSLTITDIMPIALLIKKHLLLRIDVGYGASSCVRVCNFSKWKRRQFFNLLTRHPLQLRWCYSSSKRGNRLEIHGVFFHWSRPEKFWVWNWSRSIEKNY